MRESRDLNSVFFEVAVVESDSNGEDWLRGLGLMRFLYHRRYVLSRMYVDTRLSSIHTCKSIVPLLPLLQQIPKGQTTNDHQTFYIITDFNFQNEKER